MSQNLGRRRFLKTSAAAAVAAGSAAGCANSGGDSGKRNTNKSAMSRNVELFRAIIERGFNQGDLSVADEICAQRLTEHEYLAAAHLPGPEILKSQIREARRGVRDLKLTIEDIVEADDKVWARIVARSTDLRTGKALRIDVIDICRFEDGRLVEHWGVPDRFALLHQLGVLPDPPA